MTVTAHTHQRETPAAMDADAPFLQATSLTKTFGSHRAVDNVSLNVARGEVISIIGPSGAGKSSFIRCLNMLEMPDEGQLRIGDAAVDFNRGVPGRAEVGALRRQTGMVFQAFNLFPHLSALKNVALAQVRVLNRSKRDAEERAMAQLERVGLTEKANAYPGQCSGGQQQRIAIARALAMDPDLMLFDEPTSGLDPEIGAEILAVMRELAADKMTMLVVTHEMEFARQVSHEIAVMVDGAVIEQGVPDKIMNDPEHERTRKFLSAVLGR